MTGYVPRRRRYTEPPRCPLQVLPEGVPYPVVADRTDAAIGIVVIVQVVRPVVPCLMHQITGSIPVKKGIDPVGVFSCTQP